MNASGSSAIQVDRVTYRGWKNALRIRNNSVELVILTEVGPRILFFGFLDGPNEFHEVAKDSGLTGGSDFRSYGGHRLWVSPEVARTYFPDNIPTQVTESEGGVRVTAPVEATPPGTGLQKEMEIRLAPTGTHVHITHRIANRGKDGTELAPWAISVMAPGGKAILPFPPKAPFRPDRLLPEGVLALWSYTDLSDPRWVLGKKYLQLQHDANPAGFREQMGGIWNPHGWGSYFRDGHLFVKSSPVNHGARYPDFGCNFEVFTEPGFLELETLGPLRTLAPGEVCEHREDWWLYNGVPHGESEQWIDEAILPNVVRDVES